MESLSLGLLDGLCPAVPQGLLGPAGCLVADLDVPLLAFALGLLAWGAFSLLRRLRGEDPTRFVLPLKASGLGGGTRHPKPRISDEDYEKQRAAMRQALSPLRPLPTGLDPSERVVFAPGTLRAPGNGGPRAAYGKEITVPSSQRDGP